MPSLAEVRENVANQNDSAVDTDDAPKVDAPTAEKPARAPKVAKEPTDCACQTPECSSKSKGKFAPGHDAKLVKHLTAQVVYGDMSVEDAEAALKERSGNSVLLLNKLRGSIERESGVKERKARREAAKTEVAETKAATEVDAAATAE